MVGRSSFLGCLDSGEGLKRGSMQELGKTVEKGLLKCNMAGRRYGFKTGRQEGSKLEVSRCGVQLHCISLWQKCNCCCHPV